MKVVTRITFRDENGEKFFGEGPARLLRNIEEHGSLRAAALSMDMAYTKALKLMKNAEAALGFSLITRTIGGKSGGGSILTPDGKAWLSKYEAYTAACAEANRQMLRKFFPKVGCVIMASGLGKRFGSNKLMAEFNGTPMILQALKASESLSENRVVVTRHKEVAELCEQYGVKVVLHMLPHRSDTVRLGLEALEDIDGCMFLPADQPLLRKQTINDLVLQWSENQEFIMRPSCNGTPGAPVLFPQWAFQELKSLPEGKGGSWLISQHPQSVKEMSILDTMELVDADTPQTLAMLKQYIK